MIISRVPYLLAPFEKGPAEPPTPVTQSPDEIVILAAGGVLCRNTRYGAEVLVVHRKRYDDWTLPKGKVKTGESVIAAALREVEEETGCVAQLEEYLGAIGYPVNGVPKTVLFWRMTPLEQKKIEDREEVAEVVWMPVAAAVQRLTHPDERMFVVRAMKEGGTYKTPGKLDLPPLQGFRRLLWTQKHDYARLQREYAAFRVDLALLEAQNQQWDRPWVAAARDQLNNVEHFLRRPTRDVEGGWVCLHAARRYAMHGIAQAELAMQASILNEEANKFSSWRAKQMQSLVSVKDTPVSAGHVINAMALRDEYFSNQYHKIWLTGRQLAILLVISGLGLLLLVPLVVFYSRYPGCTIPPWGYQMVAAVLFFGLLGAAFSAAGSLMNTTSEKKVPEQVANQFVTSARSLFGAGVGLAGYALYQSKALDIHFGSDAIPGSALAVAFLFGFAGERLIARVLGSLGADKA